ncbi:type II toxin-antitoxin system PemK/MazF family toxin [Campylobacter helveticus]|uniref:type II toxin-antitoxin system PemK/MazF family toxin n=1 Tax=Campylobacter helveticus TaxID=28898 RepID=UPI0009C1FA12|nr:type II toxin-antitoxin system PemK/MazF family toxin [Campylobacter helveticus]ARE80587.1 putative toxin-antitoxin system, toxin component, PemK family [Campylobacter helveticus]TNH32641.1 type II toxin-antitoxin system PemK/MazF family toxin [Campylobacter helveticus]TXK52578.1 type II toxin-antitoxin system PemK/MazF family toxin [Campylobacter helveticus]SMC22564.1 mRNA interferase MazF [Campylobacter helveticus]SUW83323.1 mRNA interferase MazF9 [Campylobacter helveticus]
MALSKTVKYGELWITDFEPQMGEEITKKRPALIVSNTQFNLSQKLVFVVPLTTWQQRFYKGIWFLRINKNATNGLDVDSAINCSQLKSFSKDRLIKKIGEVDEKILKEVKFIIDEILDSRFN